jgi:hypothetical protein
MFGPLESKTIRPVLRFVLIRSQVGLHGRGVDGLLVVPRRTPLPALYWATDKVSGLESRSVTIGKHIFSLFTSWKAYLSCLNSSGLPYLLRQAVFLSSGPHVRSGKPTDSRRVFWCAGPTCRGRLWAWSVGTQGYPSLTPTALDV